MRCNRCGLLWTMTWHQMAAEAPSGPSVRLAMGAYQRINMNNTSGGGGD